MDLLSILNASDSSEGGDAGGGFDLDQNSEEGGLDLEDILRENDEEDEDDLLNTDEDYDDDDYNNGIRHNQQQQPSLHDNKLSASWRNKSNGSNSSSRRSNRNDYFTNAAAGAVPPARRRSAESSFSQQQQQQQQHNSDDWAVLQHILNESDGDDDDDDDVQDWMSSTTSLSNSNIHNNKYATTSVLRHNDPHYEQHSIDALVRSSSTTDEDEHPAAGAASVDDSLSLDRRQSMESTNSTDDLPSWQQQPKLLAVKSDEKKMGEPQTAAPSSFAAWKTNKQSRLKQQQQQQHAPKQPQVPDPSIIDDSDDFDNDNDDNYREVYHRALSHAQTSERKLLKSGHREIVSPLMVKRRLKPKIELSARFVNRQQQPNKSSTHQRTQNTIHNNKNKNTSSSSTPRGGGREQQQQQRVSTRMGPRFSFSGIVENKKMNGVSESLVKHADPEAAKVLCGLPTCLAFNSKFIAVGTQMGIILIYDLFEVLRQRLGSNHHHHHNNLDDSSSNATDKQSAAGSITSLDLSQYGEAVVAGYTSGILVVWDTIRGTVLRTVSDVHPSPITSARFLTELKMVTVDAGGLVNKLNFSKNLLWSNYSVETECLLDGTAGQILAMNVLPPYSTVKPLVRPEPFAKVLRNLTLIALSSERSSFAVAVEPKVNVLHRWARPSADRMNPIITAAADAAAATAMDQPPAVVYLPCLSWGWALISGGGNLVMPVLARAWGCCLQLLCASFPTLDEDNTPVRIGEEPVVHWPAFGVHNEFDAKTPIVALEWLNERSLMYLTVTHEFTLVDTVMMTLLERLDFSGFQLVYAEFSLSRSAVSRDGVVNGGDTSTTSLAAACTTFQNSTRCSDDRLMVLCQNELRCISIVGAKRRISALEADGEWLEALAFALDHYENTVVSQEDRKRNPNARKDLSKHPGFASVKSDDEEWIAKLLIRYLNLAVENAPESASNSTMSPYSTGGGGTRIDLAQSHFQMLAGVCIEFCVVTRRLDLLFGPIFRRFQSVGYVDVFLDVLEPYVLNDKLAYIAPEVMSFFVEHCKATNGIATVERCLLHMDCTIMDFDSILTLLRVNEMYSALFYVFNQGLDDYVTPLEILLEKVFSEADAGAVSPTRRRDGVLQNDFERLGYKAILYLQSCFHGKTFPQEKPLEPEERAHSVKLELLQFLTQESFSPSPHVKKPVNLLPLVGQRSLPFPYMRILLLVDPRGMLDTLSLALDSADSFLLRPRATSDVDGWVDGGSGGGNNSNNTQQSQLPDKQEIMVDLAAILLPKSSKDQTLQESNVFQSRGAVNAFLDFAAKYVMNGAVQVDKTITFMMLTRVSGQYSAAKDPTDRRSLQRQAMDILSALPRDSYDPDKVLGVFNRSRMHRAALLLHQQVASSWHEADLDDIGLRSRHFLSAIDCYIGDDDPVFRMDVFDYIKKECSGGISEKIQSEGDSSQPTSLRDALFARLSALVHLDALMMARLVAELFDDDLDRVIRALEANDGGEGQFLFLQAIESGNLVEADPVAGSVLNLTIEHHHKYLELMAKLHPEMVYDYLSTHDNYRTEECLRLCEKYDIADASAYLLERMGNVSSALQLILQTLETRMMGLKRTIRGMGVEAIRQQANRRFSQGRHASAVVLPTKQVRDVEGVRRILVVALDLCERNSGTFASNNEKSDSKFKHGELWFNVLDRLINAKGFLRLSKEQPEHAKVMAGVLSELLRLTMQRMVSSVPLSDLVRKVTADHSGSRIGELREMVEGLLATYGYELKVFKGAMTVFQQDARSMRKKQLELQQQGTPVQKLMNTPLEPSGKASEVPADPLPQLISSQNGVLRLSSHGNATLVGGSRASAQSGLGDAMSRLRSRRGTKKSEFSHRLTKRGADLTMMTATERMYQAKETEPVVDGNRRVGALGNAQHRGRLVSFQ